MIFTSTRASVLALAASALLAPAAASTFDCKEIMAQKTEFDFSKLGGPHMVHWEEKEKEQENHSLMYKYNFTLDICNVLKSSCHNGARVCGMRDLIDLSTGKNNTLSTTPIDIAGTYETHNQRELNAQFKLLQEEGREGLRATLHGGRFPFDDNKGGVDQRAIIDFVCDADREGLEGVEKGLEKDDGKNDGDKDGKDGKDSDKDGKDGKDSDKKGGKDENSKDGEKDGKKEERRNLATRESKCEDSDNSLRFCGYVVEEDTTAKDNRVHTLRLEWRTKYACKNLPSEDNGSSWGFFGWFFIILFLVIASYLIFGSWLNYNRYGARGWDLLPHGDAIRDVPYIAKDFGRRIIQTVQGGGSRGGYAAV